MTTITTLPAPAPTRVTAGGSRGGTSGGDFASALDAEVTGRGSARPAVGSPGAPGEGAPGERAPAEGAPVTVEQILRAAATVLRDAATPALTLVTDAEGMVDEATATDMDDELATVLPEQRTAGSAAPDLALQVDPAAAPQGEAARGATSTVAATAATAAAPAVPGTLTQEGRAAPAETRPTTVATAETRPTVAVAAPTITAEGSVGQGTVNQGTGDQEAAPGRSESQGSGRPATETPAGTVTGAGSPAAAAVAQQAGATGADTREVAPTPATTTPGVAPAISGVAAPAAPAETSAPSAAPPPAAPAAPEPRPLAEQIGVRLAALRGAGDGQHVLTLRVDPDTFGPVRVVAHIGPEGMRIELLGGSDQAREALRAALPDLRRDLAATGLTADLGLGQGTGGGAEKGNGSASGTGEGSTGGTDGPVDERTDVERRAAALADLTQPSRRHSGLDLIA
ncbi:flagellar hook-length control protein FliK [Actinotalea sp. K2]|uniref:flagellar hook-length control protein FliK n=1 Tax=Actinotalea sp. K2 TaxID=2939438 RepID=UPI0020171699|nr:flagellar hook-length control protein FliK [Actinotalea sp. K2]MCL3860861.1 flagellar hook-length control protein FliK [Actinotalea sp. K2]